MDAFHGERIATLEAEVKGLRADFNDLRRQIAGRTGAVIAWLALAAALATAAGQWVATAYAKPPPPIDYHALARELAQPLAQELSHR